MKMVVYSSHLLNNKGILNIFKSYIFEKRGVVHQQKNMKYFI